MRLRGCLLVAVLIALATTNTRAIAPLGLEHEEWPDFRVASRSYTKTNMSTSVPMAPSPLIAEDSVLSSAYYDTLSILSSENFCSEFFGGPDSSVDIFNRFVNRVRKDHLQSPIGIRMSGLTTSVFNARTKKQYRLFDKVALNTKGPFYRQRVSNAEPVVPRVGSFQPNTREARMLIFLHELGHLVKKQDGDWLLPNDGGREDLSRNNTLKVEEVCGDEIKNVAKGETAPSGEVNSTQEQLF